MIGFSQYNFCGDVNATDPAPTNVTNVVRVQIQEGIFNHLNVTNNTAGEYAKQPPQAWDINTLFDCNFEDNISGGNIDEITKDITSVRIKRREKGTFDWVTIKEVQINNENDLHFVFTDNLNLNYTEYEYAFVPVTSDVEGAYTVQSIWSEFAGVFICDVDTVYKFMQGVQYGTTNMVQQVGVFTPFGKEYPVVMSNGAIRYQTGSITGLIVPDEFTETGVMTREQVVAQRNALLKFLTNKRAKIIKDWNGNAWLCYITDNIGTAYSKGSGMGVLSVTAQWTEVGDVKSKKDLYNNGMIPRED